MQDMFRHLTYIFPIFALTSLVLIAEAHELDPLRTVIVQVEPNRLDLMILFEEPPGPRASLLLAKYDVDQNGLIEGPEAELAGREMLPRMLAGLQFEVLGERPRTGEPKIKFQTTPSRGITAAAFVSYELATLDVDAPRTIEVRNLPLNHGLSAEFLIRAGQGLQITASTHPHSSGLATQPFTLTPGNAASATLTHIVEPTTEVSEK